MQRVFDMLGIFPKGEFTNNIPRPTKAEDFILNKNKWDTGITVRTIPGRPYWR